MLRVYHHQEPDYLPLQSDIQQIGTIGSSLAITVNEGKRVGGKKEIDIFGQNWVYEETIRAYNPDATNYIVKDVTKWREYITIPDLDAIDWKARFDADAIELDRENKVILVRDGFGIWERAFSMIHIEDLLSGLLEEPDAMYDFFSMVADHKIKLHNYYYDYYKPDVLAFHDDYGHGGGLFMSPETWRALIKPHLQRVIDNAKAHGVLYEHHCCGYMVPLAKEIAEMGAASWNSVHYCNNPIEAKKLVGSSIALTGGMLDVWTMDAPDTTEAQIRSHVKNMCENMLPGWIYMSGNAPDNPDRNPIIQDELLKSGQPRYREMRPANA